MAKHGLSMLRRAQGALGTLTGAQKAVGAIALLAVLLGGMAFVRWVSAPTMAPMFTNLAAADASAIVEQLDSQSAKYELADGGQTVLVPREDVYRLRLAMSSAGLPTSGDTGYALLDQQGVTTSQFQQQVTYQRALEGELARTIGAIDGVQAAVVHLAIPQKDVFLDETSNPTASVLVDTKPGKSLPGQQVQSLIHLVSSSDEGMAPEDVTVVDAAGNLLSAAGQGTAAAAGGAREQQTLDYETNTGKALQAMLDRVIGPGNAVATVTAELDFDATDRTSETFTAQDGVPPLSETKSTEEYTGGGGTPVGGILGPDNIQVPAGGGNADSSYRKESATSNNAVNKVTEKTSTAPGAVRRQSVAVVVDRGAAGAIDMTELTAMVSTAAGIDPERGDTVSVTRMAFDQSAADRAAADLAATREAEKRDQLMGMARTVGIALAVVIALIVAFVISRRRRAVAQPIDLEHLEFVRSMQSLGSAETDALEAAEDAVALPPAPRQAPDETGQMRDQVTDLVERQPEEVAELLRGWLADRRG
jgi:flagellar M-ring protein FliF